MSECPDCKGTGKYVGFRVIEDCDRCKGTGDEGQAWLGVPSTDGYTLVNEWDVPDEVWPGWTIVCVDGVEVRRGTGARSTRERVDEGLKAYSAGLTYRPRLRYIGYSGQTLYFEEVGRG